MQSIQNKNYEVNEVTGDTYSEVIDLTEANMLSIQCVIDVNTPSAKTFDGPITADVVIQDLTYAADTAGASGNDITLTYINTGLNGESLAVDVEDDTRIIVTLETDTDGVEAEVEIQDLTYTAANEGDAGNDITIEYIDGGEAGEETVEVTGTNIVVTIEDGVSTATEVKAAIDGSAAALALVSVAITGTGSNAQEVVAETPLADGADPSVLSDADAIKAAIEGDATAAALVDITVSGTGANVQTVQAETALEDGVDAEIDVDANTITIPSHGLSDGLKGQLTTTGTLPGGLATTTDYFVIVVDDDTIKLASSRANAMAGTAINITNLGSDQGVHTFTPTALAGASVELQKSNDKAALTPSGTTNWTAYASATSITVDATHWFELDPNEATFKYARLKYTCTAGRISSDNYVYARG